MIVGLFVLKGQTTQNLYEKAVTSTREGKFQEADYYFRKLIREKTNQPQEFNYYYGYTLFNLKKNGIAEKFLKEFVDYSSKEDSLHKKARSILLMLNPEHCRICKGKHFFMKDTVCFPCTGSGKIERKCKYCNGTQKIPCHECKGKGILQQTTNFSQNNFTKCNPCEGKGYEICKECKIGETKIIDCVRCNGKGLVKVRKSCNHLE